MNCQRELFEYEVVVDKLYACGGSGGRRELNSVDRFDGEKWAPSSNMSSSKVCFLV